MDALRPLPTRRRVLASGLAMAVAGMSGCAAFGVPARPPLIEFDRQFLLQAAASGVFEVEAARLGEQRAINEMVKTYAAMLARHHGELNDELEALARARDVTLPEDLAREKRAVINALAALPPESFDVRFVQQVGIAGHQSNIEMFEQARRAVKDPELLGWTLRTLAAMQQHLSTAQQLPTVVKTLAGQTGGAMVPV